MLSFLSSPMLVCVDRTFIVDVWMDNVSDLYAYQIEVTSNNPTAIEMTKIENGDFLIGDLMALPWGSQTAGRRAFTATKKYQIPGSSGSGSLVRITMRALQPGKEVIFAITTTGDYPTMLTNSDIDEPPEQRIIPFTPISGVIYTDDCAVPTSVNLLGFNGSSSAGAVNLTWETASETQNLGFNLYRANSPDGARVKINTKLIRSHGGAGNQIGSTYEYRDAPKAAGGVLGSILRQAKNGRPYFYWLEDIDVNGKAELHGPIEVKLAK